MLGVKDAGCCVKVACCSGCWMSRMIGVQEDWCHECMMSRMFGV